METIESKNGKLTWLVFSSQIRRIRKQTRTYYAVKCSKCGYRKTGQKTDIQKIKTCVGCSKIPAAVKMDSFGNCVHVCELGMVEFVREFQEKHDVTEREAVRHFVETVKAHLPAGDPIAEKITDESVRAKVRRETGKKLNSGKRNQIGAVSPNNDKDTSAVGKHQEETKTVIDIFTMQQYLDKHLPCVGCGHDRFDVGFFCRLCGSRQPAAMNLEEHKGKQ